LQPFRDPKHATLAANIFSQENDAVIRGHLATQGVVNRLNERA
jgi:hypothetical protein